MAKNNEKLFIELYNLGKTDLEISQLLGLGERTVARKAQRLRSKGKIKSRKELKFTDKLGLSKLNDIDVENIVKKAKAQWKISKSTKTLNENKPFKTYLYIADNHVPEHNIPAHKSIFKLMDDIKFDGFRIVGDFMDMSPISHWNKNKKKTLETQRLKEHYAIGNALLDEFDKRLPKNCDKGYFYGNHELWHDQLIEEMPVLEGLIDPADSLNLEKRNYKIYKDENHIERIGRLSVFHGIYATVYSVRKHIQNMMTNVLFFHTHRIGMRSEKSAVKEIAIVGYNGGCLCNKNPNYLRNKPSAWSHGFTIVHYMANGNFYVENIRIIKGKFVYNGKIYDGNK